APSASVAHTDDRRRFLIVRGDESSITAASTPAAMFDLDSFPQVSPAAFKLNPIAPQDLIGDLRPLLGPAADQVDFVPVPRLSTLIVLARNPQMIGVVQGWVARFDVPSVSVSPGL